MPSTSPSSDQAMAWRIGKLLGTFFVGLCLAAIVLNVALPYGSRAADQALALKPAADTFVKKSDPDRNFGSASTITVDARPTTTSLIRFQVNGVGANNVAQARLRLYVYDGSPQAGLQVFTTASDWDETSVTWNNQPALGPQVATLAPLAMQVGSWIEVDLGQAVPGDGVYSFALTTDTTDQLRFRSRTRAEAPQLVLTLRSGAADASPAPTQPPPTVAPTQQPPPTATPAQPLPDGHPMGCQPGEIFIDAQDWWSTTPGMLGQDGQPGDDFGHLHTSLCFPHQATVSGQMTLRIRSVMHHNPGQFDRLTVQIFAPKVSGASTACGDSYAVACAVFKPARTCPIDQTCRWEDTLTFNTADIAYDGWQQVRVRGRVRQPDGKEMLTSTGLQIYVQNGHPIKNITDRPDFAEARGWYTDVGYATSTLLAPPTGPVSGIWEPSVKLEEGADGIPITGYYCALDTDFHNGNPGIPVLQGNGPYRGKLRIDTTRLSNGWHRLFLKTDAFDPVTGSTNSGVLAVFFEVRN